MRKFETPAPWRDHPRDFWCRTEDQITDAMVERFDRQSALLGELVTPLSRDDGLERTVHFKSGFNPMKPTTPYTSYISAKRHDAEMQRSLSRSNGKTETLFYDAVCFDGSDDGRAYVVSVTDLSDIPFQGFGRFALAILASNVRRNELELFFSKIALSRFLGVVPQDIECIVIVRASRIQLKRLPELSDCDVPVLFDFSGRTTKDKTKIDPTEGIIERVRKGYSKKIGFQGTLTPGQASVLDEALTAKNSKLIVQELAEGAIGRSSVWPLSVVSILTFDHEDVSGMKEPDADNEVPRVVSRHIPAAWQLSYAEFPPESMPTSDDAMTIKRMHDIGTIWRNALRGYNVSLSIPYDRDTGSMEIHEDQLRKLGHLLEIDKLVDDYYNTIGTSQGA